MFQPDTWQNAACCARIPSAGPGWCGSSFSLCWAWSWGRAGPEASHLWTCRAEQGSLGSPHLELRPWVQDPSSGPQAHATPRVLQSCFPDALWGCHQARHPQGPGAASPEEQPRASRRVAARPGCQGAEVSHPADLSSEFGYKRINLAKTFFFHQMGGL